MVLVRKYFGDSFTVDESASIARALKLDAAAAVVAVLEPNPVPACTADAACVSGGSAYVALHLPPHIVSHPSLCD
uniref:CipA n=1 Tax=Ganoderma boninense TaxID=34458 RepID=A0A5K1JYY6_9APHY|nr:CipA [Ganoderma boninense]